MKTTLMMISCRSHYFRLITCVLLCHVLEFAAGCAVDDAACICDGGDAIVCTEMQLQYIPQFYEEDTLYSVIDLGKNKIKKIGPNAFKHLKVQKIKIWGNVVNPLQIHKKAFRGLEDSVEILLIKRSHVRELPESLFRKMRKLWNVNLSGNHLMKITKGVFHGAKSIQILDLSTNSFEELTASMFMGLRNLTVLKLGNNKINHMVLNAFHGLQSLEELDLSSNQIRDLQPRTFKKIKNLQKLLLGSNNIPAIFPMMFQGLSNLKTLVLSGNPLITIFDHSFSAMSNLVSLELKETHILFFKPGMFAGLRQLQTLFLDRNNMSDLSDGLFQKLPALSQISLESNNLITVNPCSFKDIRNMKVIWLKDNPIDCSCSMQWTTQEEAQQLSITGTCKSPKVYKNYKINENDMFDNCAGMDNSVTKCKQLVTNKIEV